MGAIEGDAKEKAEKILAQVLAETYDCTRVWEAWNYGTMTADDFVELSPERISEAVTALAVAGLLVPAEPSPIYTVRRIPYTAGAKTSAGYDSVDFEIVAKSAGAAISKAVVDCEWRDPERNFLWRIVGSKVVVS